MTENFTNKWRLYKLPEKVRIKWYRNFYKRMNKSNHSAGVFLHSTTPISSPVYVAGSGYFLTESPGDEIVTALKIVILFITDNLWIKHWSKDQVLLPPGNQSMLNDHQVNIWKVLDDAYIYLPNSVSQPCRIV